MSDKNSILESVERRADELRLKNSDERVCQEIGERLKKYLSNLVETEPAVATKLLEERNKLRIEKDADGKPVGYTKTRAIIGSYYTNDFGLKGLIGIESNQARRDCQSRN